MLFDIYKWDIDSGGAGIGEDVPGIIRAQATAAERRVVSDWARSTLPPAETWPDDYDREPLDSFLRDPE